MSRSYKKNTIIKDHNNGKKDQKRQANSSIRMQLKQGIEMADGNAYQKHTERWNICDVKWLKTEEDARKQYQEYIRTHELMGFEDSIQDFLTKYPTEDDFINRWWKKRYKRK